MGWRAKSPTMSTKTLDHPKKRRQSALKMLSRLKVMKDWIAWAHNLGGPLEFSPYFVLF